MKNKRIYYDIYSEFNDVNKFREMKTITHHGNNRLSHINRVAKLSLILSKKLGLDYISCTRGAIMHDFFTLDDINKVDIRMWDFLREHPSIALNNSMNYFKVNNVEKDIILSHMYPLTKKKPEYAESKLVCVTDKLVSIYEFFRYQLNFSLEIGIIYFVNIMNL